MGFVEPVDSIMLAVKLRVGKAVPFTPAPCAERKMVIVPQTIVIQSFNQSSIKQNYKYAMTVKTTANGVGLKDKCKAQNDFCTFESTPYNLLIP